MDSRKVAALAALGVTALSAPAWAEPPATLEVIQLEGGFRYGFDQEEGDFNPWGPGIGIGVGYTLSNAIYVGGVVEYFFGDKADTLGGEITANVFQITAEGGYDLGLSKTLVLRPKIGAGLAITKTELCDDLGSCQSDSPSDLVVAPGVAFLYLGPSISFGLDLRYDMIFADPEMASAILLAVGIGF